MHPPDSGQAILSYAPLHRISRYLRALIKRILKPKDATPPLIWMIICAVSTVIPLLCGDIRGELPLAIYGALTGYFIALGDHRGSLLNRLLIATIGLMTNGVCFTFGIKWHQHFWIFIPCSLAAVYISRLFGGKGAELERLLLFSVVNLMVARYAFWVRSEDLPVVLSYFLVAYGAAVVVILISQFVHPEYQAEFLPARDAIQEAFTLNPLRHFYSFTYVCTVAGAILCVEWFQMSRGYWMVITVLLTLKPDKKESFHRVVQRLFGSILGVIAGEFLILLHPSIPEMIGISFLCALFVPYVWNRNYWLVTFLATLLVITLLGMAQYGHLDAEITWFRLQASLAGCALCLFSLWIFRQLENIIPKRLLQE